MTALEASTIDVAIVGLGPVGAVAAQLLAREGLSVLAIEPDIHPFDQPRAIGIDHESLRLLQSIGLADQFAPKLGVYAPSEYLAADGRLLRRIIPQSEPHPLSWPPYATFVQPELETILRNGLERWSSLTVAYGERVTDLRQDDGGIILTLADLNGAQRKARARFVLACDGARSPVRERLSIELEDLGFNEPWLVVDLLVEDDTGLPRTTVQFCDPRRRASYIAGPGKLRRWEIMLLPDDVPHRMTEPDTVWALLSRWITPDRGRIWRAATYNFHALVARRFRRGSVFLAGDAAHQTPPFMAQGLNQGFRDVGNLCWKLGQVLRHGANPELLNTYDAERRPNARAVIELTKRFGVLICERDPVKVAERNRLMLEEVSSGRGEMVRQDLLPPLHHGFLQQDKYGGRPPGVGRPLPQPMVSISGPSFHRLDDALLSRFLLIVPKDWVPTEAEQMLAARLDIGFACLGKTSVHPTVQPISEQNSVLVHWMDAYHAHSVLARPDKVVFATAHGNERPGYLIRLLETTLAAGRALAIENSQNLAGQVPTA
jgi:3-(3-hydroxy-phenyl)propionate hydroxylase